MDETLGTPDVEPQHVQNSKASTHLDGETKNLLPIPQIGFSIMKSMTCHVYDQIKKDYSFL